MCSKIARLVCFQYKASTQGNGHTAWKIIMIWSPNSPVREFSSLDSCLESSVPPPSQDFLLETGKL